MLTWFRETHMQTNPDKFKMMVFDRCKHTAHSRMVNDAVMASRQGARILWGYWSILALLLEAISHFYARNLVNILMLYEGLASN